MSHTIGAQRYCLAAGLFVQRTYGSRGGPGQRSSFEQRCLPERHKDRSGSTQEGGCGSRGRWKRQPWCLAARTPSCASFCLDTMWVIYFRPHKRPPVNTGGVYQHETQLLQSHSLQKCTSMFCLPSVSTGMGDLVLWGVCCLHRSNK